jgi:hypothetical protein
MQKQLSLQWWAVDESRMMVFGYYSNASKYTPVGPDASLGALDTRAGPNASINEILGPNASLDRLDGPNASLDQLDTRANCLY